MGNDSKVGGVLAIISGAIGVLRVFGYLFVIVIMIFSGNSSSRDFQSNFVDVIFPVILFLFAGIMYFILGSMAIVGGIFALKKKYWGWALTGAIASTIAFFPCGIAALIFIAKSQPEFKKEITPLRIPDISSSDDGLPTRSML